MGAVDDVILAAVVHIDPNHPDPGWGPLFLALLGLAGCVVAGAGGYLILALWRAHHEKKWGDYAIGPVFLAIGLVMTVVGFGFALRLL
ncbi:MULTISPECIES: hypothetical protein [Streptomyces]|uniref:Uncharacterized protein n=1 Tax=Streptomyces yunnanensis TaxID=156453 RepID=A0ABY8A7U9_9ACTN|nr:MULTISPECIES: hypothetical protein [Streptomyces]AJC56706.1 hypothetical protein GZL_04124 [Streptomyces sp. 769]WEB41050.1 hypothetical protein MOV08_18355 [Streptomyces yunnanensis]